jgi:iron complex outermembrane receptor protein
LNTHSFPLSVLAIALATVLSPAWAQDAAPAPAADAQKQDTETSPAATSLERIEVTGTRLQHGDVTSRVIIIDQEEIRSRGVTSVEELMRTLPQNLATIGNITNERGRGPLGAETRGNPRAPSPIGTLGVSAANLGGMGAGNTLVLINGRRMAGAAGIEDGFVNLNNIPLSAVDRVEINLDGASAVYGSDAIGGVINFILKKNFIGSTLNVQHEYSNNGADNSRISLYSGYAWGSGNVSITLDHNERDPIINRKTGYVTNDYSSYFNDNPSYDYRSFASGLQPGVIDQSETIWNPDTLGTQTITRGLSVPPGFVGAPGINDFILLDRNSLRDVVPREDGADAKSNSVTLHFEQKLTDKLSFSADGMYTRTKNSQEEDFQNLGLQLGPGQYYNPFPAYYFSSWEAAPIAYYYPGAEIASGELPPGMIENTSSAWNANFSLAYAFNDDTRAELIYTTSASKTGGNYMNFGSLVNSFQPDINSPSGYSCYNFELANNRLSGTQLAQQQEIFDRQCLALSSTDPNLAFNPWKSTADGGGSSIRDFYYRFDDDQRNSRTENIEFRLNGSLYELPAGKIYYAVGGEWYEDGVDSAEVRNYTGERASRDRSAYFAELTIPVFGRDFTLPGVQGLTLNAAARRDRYDTEGAIGTVDGIPIDQGGQIVYGSNIFARVTPSFGFRWDIAGGLSLRGRLSKGFQAPPFTNLFDVTGSQTFSTGIFQDPLYDCNASNSCDYPWSQDAYYAPRTTAPNPNLRPQTSTQRSYTLSWYPRGALQGLMLDVSWNNTRINNEYADMDDLNDFLTQGVIYGMAEFYPRDETGRIIAMQNQIFNIMGSEYESITYEASYRFATPIGNFEPKVTYLDNRKAERQAFPGTKPVSTLGRIQGPDDYRVVGSLRWDRNALTATLWANYTPSYTNDYLLDMAAGSVYNPELSRAVGSYLSYDLTVAWRLRENLRLNFAGRNIFDKEPRFVVIAGRPYDTARYNVAGRTLSLEAQYDF